MLEYTERQRFKFKLSRAQCRDLIVCHTGLEPQRQTSRQGPTLACYSHV